MAQCFARASRPLLWDAGSRRPKKPVAGLFDSSVKCKFASFCHLIDQRICRLVPTNTRCDKAAWRQVANPIVIEFAGVGIVDSPKKKVLAVMLVQIKQPAVVSQLPAETPSRSPASAGTAIARLLVTARLPPRVRRACSVAGAGLKNRAFRFNRRRRATLMAWDLKKIRWKTSAVREGSGCITSASETAKMEVPRLRVPFRHGGQRVENIWRSCAVPTALVVRQVVV
jgi:hypothetical protein